MPWLAATAAPQGCHTCDPSGHATVCGVTAGTEHRQRERPGETGRDRPRSFPAPPKSQPRVTSWWGRGGEGRGRGPPHVAVAVPCSLRSAGAGPDSPDGAAPGAEGFCRAIPTPGAAPPCACVSARVCLSVCVSVCPCVCQCVPSRPRSAPAPGGRSRLPPPSPPHGAGGTRAAGGGVSW